MPSIDEIVKNQGVEENEFVEGVAPTSPLQPEGSPEISFDFGWLKTPTGEGSIEEYVEHPLNFMKSKGFAQILRGLTGFMGNLKLAVLDIGLGALNFMKERAKDGVKNGPIQ